jgi:uncharacterized membrane protein YraQ (UPF0718 family)
MNLKKIPLNIVVMIVFSIFITVSFMMGFHPGEAVGNNFFSFAGSMLKILPCAFILIGLFEVWVKKESVEKHLGENAGFTGYLWMILLAGTTVGGLYVAFPVAYSLYKKGARLSYIFTYIGASAVCRIPMMIFEASFLGVKFTLIRLLVSMPLVIVSAVVLGNYLEKRGYEIESGGQGVH